MLTNQIRRKEEDVLFWLRGPVRFDLGCMYLPISICEDLLLCDRFGGLLDGSLVSRSQSCLSPCPGSRHDCYEGVHDVQ